LELGKAQIVPGPRQQEIIATRCRFNDVEMPIAAPRRLGDVKLAENSVYFLPWYYKGNT